MSFIASRLRSLAALGFIALTSAGGVTLQPAQGTGIREVDVPVPMRDGVVLRADVIRPAGSQRFPTLVYRTPYGKAEAQRIYTTFQSAVSRGYAVVIQDVRGRYASAGEFRPYQNEGRDGYDTIEWAAAQPWSNGAVGTFGLSYPGAVQWLAAVENPPHLKAMVPAMTFSTPQNFFYAWGVWDMSWFEWIWDNMAPDVRAKRNLPGPRTVDEAVKAWKDVGPAMQRAPPLDSVTELRDIAPYFYEWLRHPPDDPFWNFAELRGRYDRTQAAVLNLSGWYDDNYGPEGATTNYAGLVRARSGNASHVGLLLGPWVHGVDSTSRSRIGIRDFGQRAGMDYDATVLTWMDRYVRGLDQAPAGAPVRYFVMGRNEWRGAEAWPPSATATTYYLRRSDASRHAGMTPVAPPTRDVPSMFVSDPNRPVENQYEAAGPHDYRALADRQDVLTFDSAPLDDDLEVTGPITARLYVSCACRDIDLWVHVLDVSPDGTAANVMSPGLNVQRASYRDLSRGRQLLESGRIYAIDLDHLMTSNVFASGHRVRVQISASFFPNFSRNLQTGELEQRSSEGRRATIRIYHDRTHASRITLPVVVH
ncbi:MAG: CocE/NonD family hydrolase [Acidobacteriota bacterium]